MPTSTISHGKRRSERPMGTYNLVFTKGGVESDLREDNFFTFGLSEEPDLLGYGGETIFYSIRNAI